MHSTKKNKTKIIIVGSIPPPIGGVSVHIERLILYLEQNNLDYILIDISRKKKINKTAVKQYSLYYQPIQTIWTIIKPGIKVIHCILSNHITKQKLLLLFFMKLFNCKLTITFVASPVQTLADSSVSLSSILRIARASKQIISVNTDFKELLIGNGISPDKISIFPVFIPQQTKNLNMLYVEKELFSFFNKKSLILLTYAYGPVLHNNVDLYGIDLFIDLAKYLVNHDPNIGFVVKIPGISQVDNFNKHKKAIFDAGLENSFYFSINQKSQFVSILKHTDLFIRATNTDGDAVTVRESLFMKVPTIASDFCQRPEGTILFKSRDQENLRKVVMATLPKLQEISTGLSNSKSNNAERIIDRFQAACE